MTTLQEYAPTETKTEALADAAKQAAEHAVNLAKWITVATNRLGLAMQGSGLDPDLIGAAEYIDRLKSQQDLARSDREAFERARREQEARETDALRLSLKDHPEGKETNPVGAAAWCIARLTAHLNVERTTNDLFRQHAKALLESAGVTLPAYLDHPDAPDSPIARAAQAAAVMQFGHEHDKQAYLRSRGWIMQPVGWRDSGGEVHGFDAAVKLQVRRDLEPMKHLAKPRA